MLALLLHYCRNLPEVLGRRYIDLSKSWQVQFAGDWVDGQANFGYREFFGDYELEKFQNLNADFYMGGFIKYQPRRHAADLGATRSGTHGRYSGA
jgi:hypothetical protein